MNSRLLSKNEITELEKVLDFDRFNVHVHGEELKAKVDELAAKIVFNQQEYNPQFRHLYHALSVYFAFYERNKDLALQCLEKSQASCKTNLEKAVCKGLISYVNTIRSSF